MTNEGKVSRDRDEQDPLTEETRQALNDLAQLIGRLIAEQICHDVEERASNQDGKARK